MDNKIKHNDKTNTSEKSMACAFLNNQEGSVLITVLMIMAIMTIIAIVSSKAVVNESLAVRNMAIHKQNVSLVDSALMQGLQEFMQLDNSDADNFNPALSLWINDMAVTTAGAPEELINTIWYENAFTRPCLDGSNSLAANTLPMLTARGENANNNLRYAAVGWQPIDLGTGGGSSSLVVGKGPVWREGRIIAEYVSKDAAGNDNGFGLHRQELGVRWQW